MSIFLEFNRLISETTERLIVPKGKVIVLVNPSLNSLMNAWEASEQNLRGLSYRDGTTVWWPSEMATHDQVESRIPNYGTSKYGWYLGDGGEGRAMLFVSRNSNQPTGDGDMNRLTGGSKLLRTMAFSPKVVTEAKTPEKWIRAYRAEDASRGVMGDAIPGGSYFFPDRSTAELWAGGRGKILTANVRIDNASFQAVPEGEAQQYNYPVVVRTDPEGSGKIMEIIVFDKGSISLNESGTLAYYRGLPPEHLRKVASEWKDQPYPEDPGHIDPNNADWRFVEDYPLARLQGISDWVAWFQDEIGAWADEGEPDRFSDMITQAIENPIVVFDDGNEGHIWDGHHRTGASVMSGRKTIPAIVGTRKREVTESMAPDEALRVFQKYKVDARGLDKDDLRKARSRITMKHKVHPERGGSHDAMQELNMAVDALVNQPQVRPQKPQAGFQDFEDHMAGQGKAPAKKTGFEPFQAAKVYGDVKRGPRTGNVWKA